MAGFGRLLERKAENEKWLDLRAGTIAAVISNQHRGRSARALMPGDFFPSCKDAGGGEITTLADVPKEWKVISGGEARAWMAKLNLEKQQIKR